MNYNITSLKPFGVVIEPKKNNTNVDNLKTEQVRKLFRETQFVLLRGFSALETADDFADYCEKWGKISLWPFGKVLELVQQDKPEDHIFDCSYMPLHWDGMYRPQVPEYQIFQCVKAPTLGAGGRTVFSNTIQVLENASEQHKKLWEKVTGHYQRKMEFYDSKTTSPIIVKHPLKDHLVIRYNEPHFVENGDLLNPPNTHFSGIDKNEVKDFHRTLRQALYSPISLYSHEWQTGDIVISDNFNLLHGREAFTSHVPRHIRRVQVLSDPIFNNPNLESYK